MNASTVLYLIIGIILFDTTLSFVLDWLNIKNRTQKLPEIVKDIYKEEEYKKSLDYQDTNTRFSFLSSSFSIALTLGMLLTGGFGLVSTWLEQYTTDPIYLALLFFGVLFIASDILETPFSWYQTFSIEERFGFNKMTQKLFFMDKIKGYLLGAVLGGLIMYALLYLITEIGETFWIYFWGVIVVFMLIMQMFYTSLIMPLFNKLVPLEEGELRSAIEKYAKTIDFPLTNIYVIDGSKRSTKANAFFSGIGREKKIVLYDTLIKNHTIEELVAVLAHEVGHYKKKHIPVTMAVSFLQMGVMLYVLSLMIFNKNLSIAMGAENLSIHLNLIAFTFLYTPISTITTLFSNILSRKNEFEADNFAKTTYDGKSLGEALKKLSSANLSNLTPHPTYVFFHHSHPPVYQRLEALEG